MARTGHERKQNRLIASYLLPPSEKTRLSLSVLCLSLCVVMYALPLSTYSPVPVGAPVARIRAMTGKRSGPRDTVVPSVADFVERANREEVYNGS